LANEEFEAPTGAIR